MEVVITVCTSPFEIRWKKNDWPGPENMLRSNPVKVWFLNCIHTDNKNIYLLNIHVQSRFTEFLQHASEPNKISYLLTYKSGLLNQSLHYAEQYSQWLTLGKSMLASWYRLCSCSPPPKHQKSKTYTVHGNTAKPLMQKVLAYTGVLQLTCGLAEEVEGSPDTNMLCLVT